jgi:putative Mn2+ efflux pump MntP
MAAKQLQLKWYEGRNGAIGVGLVSLVLAYVVGSRGINTGSWWEYLGTIIFLVIGFNRLIAGLRVTDKNSTQPRQSKQR